MPRSRAPQRCTYCRQKKKKCDNNSPCANCVDAHAECIYAPIQRGSISAPKPEKQSPVKAEWSETDEKSSTGSASRENNTYPQVKASEQFVRANRSLRIKTEAPADTKVVKAETPDEPPSTAGIEPSPTTLFSSDIESGCRSSTSPQIHHVASAASERLLNVEKAKLRRIFDAVLSWDCLALCLIDKERFNRDLFVSPTAYCSPVLVDALLALAAVVFEPSTFDEPTDRTTGKPPWQRFHNVLIKEATQRLYEQSWPPDTVPDIQAMGILALYCNCQGWDDDFFQFGLDFLECISRRCHGASMGGFDANSRRNDAIAYCGAMSMNRILHQIKIYESTLTGAPTLPPSSHRMGNRGSKEEQELRQQKWKRILQKVEIAKGSRTRGTNTRHDGQYTITAEFYLLVETVFKACGIDECDRSFAHAVATYIRGLEWYDGFFKTSKCHQGSEPLFLLVHAYYHYCTLCLLVPYIAGSAEVAVAGSTLLQICQQAAKDIGHLAHLHSKMCPGMRPVSLVYRFKRGAEYFRSKHG